MTIRDQYLMVFLQNIPALQEYFQIHLLTETIALFGTGRFSFFGGRVLGIFFSFRVKVGFEFVSMNFSVEVHVSSNEAFQKLYLFTNHQVEDREPETTVKRD